ncbi:MAG: serine hydrolase [Planctomycetes bacterium]|nr:serine hydrolase [Planctomycetota bacterium]
MNTLRLVAMSLLLAASTAAQAFSTYFGASVGAHQAQINLLSPQGYRPISVSVGGGLSGAHVAATWLQRPGPGWSISGVLDKSAMQAWILTQLAAGRRPLSISSSGSGTDTAYVAVFVADGVPANYVLDVDRATFDTACETARQNGRWLAQASVHGALLATRFCAVFEDNPDDIAWGYQVDRGQPAAAASASAHSAAEARCVAVAGSSLWYVTVWRDDRVGNWGIYLGLDGATYQQTLNTLSAQGYFPLAVEGHGTGSSARFSAVFVQTDVARTRVASTTGYSAPELAAFDTYMQNHLRSQGARAGTLAITKNGRLVLARGYTLAEPGYPVTQPHDRCRLASLTKPITAAAIWRIIELGTPTGTTTANSLLQYPHADPRYANIELFDLLRHTSGIPGNSDPWTVANWWSPSNPTLPTTAYRTARYAADGNLRFIPGVLWDYSNNGYCTLGRIVEAYTGQTYFNYVRSQVLAPLGITQAMIGNPSLSTLPSNEMHYHLDRLVTEESNLHTDRRPLSAQYNRDLQRNDSTGGLVMSAVDYVRVLAGIFDGGGDGQVVSPGIAGQMNFANTFNEYGTAQAHSISNAGMTRTQLGNSVHSLTKGGTYEGTSTQAIFRSDGVCIAAFVNKSFAHASLSSLNALADAVVTWPAHDKFPQFGFQPFSYACPELIANLSPPLPNLGDAPFVFSGTHLDTVTSVDFGSWLITSQNQGSFAVGWFKIVDPTRIEVYPPQGLVPGYHQVRVNTQACSSQQVLTALVRQPSAIVRAADRPTGAFEVIASRGPHSTASLALLGLAFDNLPTSIPGIVDLGIGNQGTSLLTWPGAVGCDPASSVFRWPVPDLGGFPPMYLQVAIFDPLAPSPLPLAVTDVEVVLP